MIVYLNDLIEFFAELYKEKINDYAIVKASDLKKNLIQIY